MIFSKFLDEYPKLSLAAGVCLGVGSAIGLAAYYRHRKLNSPPKKWRKVGELSDLMCFPIKSAGCIRTDSLNCSEIGLEDGFLRDRIFMIAKTNGEFVTGRGYPKTVLIQPKVEGEDMTLSAPGMRDLTFNLKRLYENKRGIGKVWDQEVSVVDAGEEVARWISRFLLSEDFGMRLLFYPSKRATREVRPKNRVFALTTDNDTGALHDATSFMLMTESSVADLNSRLEQPITPQQFRPNFVVKGPLPFEEDTWDWIRIGSQTIFRNVKPCARCVFTNIDPETAERNPKGQPLKTLKEYRTIKGVDGGPVLGIHLGVRVDGKINIGDGVYVGYANN